MPDPQRCVSPPSVPGLSLPLPLTASVPGVSVSFAPNLCCKLPSFSAGIPSIPLPPLLASGASAVLKAAQTLLNAYLANIQVTCPRG